MRRLFCVLLVALVPFAVACPAPETEESHPGEDYNEFLVEQGRDPIPRQDDGSAEDPDGSGDEPPQELTSEEREQAGDIYELSEDAFAAAVANETDCETLRQSFRVSGLGVEQGDIDADKDTVIDRASVLAVRLNELGCYDDP